MVQRVITCNPKVSVVMPIYNTRAYLAQAIASIRAQTFTDFELLLVDDGSTDDSLQIAQDCAAADPRLRVLAFPHQGYRSINLAVEEAQAPLLARMDSDDTCMPQRLALQYQYMNDHPECVAVGTWLEKTDPFGSPCGLQTPITEHDEIDRLLLEGNASGIINGTTMFRRDVWLSIGGIDTRYGFAEDVDYFTPG
ncbi:MAG: glycosyltransferase family 2 protein [Phycisphaerales bacterium]|nr:glycosyltransferase family 2 protein [Phycisphaerales bacterium]